MRYKLSILIINHINCTTVKKVYERDAPQAANSESENENKPYKLSELSWVIIRILFIKIIYQNYTRSVLYLTNMKM